MRKTIILLSIIFINYTYAQLDSTNWYPLEIGNEWHYCYGLDPVHYYTVKVVGDTVMPNGKKYAIMSRGGDTEYHRNYENKFVYAYRNTDTTEYFLYDFYSNDKTLWELPNKEDLFWGIESTKNEYNTFFKKNINYKYFDWVTIDSTNNTIDTIWNAGIDIYPIRIAQGIGVTSYSYSHYFGAEGMMGGIINGDTLGTLTSISKNVGIKNKYYLFNNYPNPFNPTTVIKFSIPERDNVELLVYNSLGQLIKVLIKENLSEGNYQVEFNGDKLSSGVYFYALKTSKYQNVKKMLLLK